MKKELIILLTAAFVFPALAQETNGHRARRGEARKADESSRERLEWTEQQRKEHMERKLQFMDKALSDIGVSEEDRIKIRELQETHRQKMKEASGLVNTARENLSKLLDNGATDEEIDAAIKNISEAQADQLRLLVGNRREMEKLLGREKYARFMENARRQYQKHGRRSGAGMPPRPGLPPIPGQGHKNSKLPPLPDAQPQPPPPPHE